MPFQDPTPLANDNDAARKEVRFTLPKTPRIPNGAGFLLTAGAGTAIGTGQVNDPTQAWQLVTLSVAAMLCDALIAFARRRGGS